MPRLGRIAIGVSVISRGLDDHARFAGSTHPAMPAMGALLVALANAVRSVVQDVLGDPVGSDVGSALEEVRVRRQRCALGVSRRAKLATEHDEAFDADELEGEWLGYAALLVQVDRIVGDLSAPVPT